MKIKNDKVILAGLQVEMKLVMEVCDSVYRHYGQEYTITSGLDGLHKAGSYHYFGYAIDSRVHFFDEEIQRKVANDIRMIIAEKSNKYDVILHLNHHLHCEYNK
jgi:isocitrate dehydrogenase kinase/phosphatase